MTAADVAAVEAANTEFYEAFEGTDYDRMAAVWVDDDRAPASCVHPGWPVVRGREQVLRSWAVIFANTPYIQFVLTDVHTEVAGDLAVVTCTENVLTSVPGSPVEGDLGGGRVVATNVFRRTAAGWRLWVHHGSPVLESTGEDEADDTDVSRGDG